MASSEVLVQLWITTWVNWKTSFFNFNSEINEDAMKEFCDTYNLKNLVSEATCYKNPLNLSSIDVFLTKIARSFQNNITVETVLLSDYHKMIFTQYYLMVMLERFRKALDNKNKFGALLTDLSKALDCLNHELLISKLAAFGFDHISLNVLLSYLSGRNQRTKVNNCFSK